MRAARATLQDQSILSYGPRDRAGGTRRVPTAKCSDRYLGEPAPMRAAWASLRDQSISSFGPGPGREDKAGVLGICRRARGGHGALVLHFQAYESKRIRRRALKGAGSSCVTPGLHAMGVHCGSGPGQ